MQVIGGDDAKDKTARILRKMLCHEVGAAFTWYGTKTKGKFSSLEFCKVMCGMYPCSVMISFMIFTLCVWNVYEKLIYNWLISFPVGSN